MTVLHFWYLTTKALHREAVKQKKPFPSHKDSGMVGIWIYRYLLLNEFETFLDNIAAAIDELEVFVAIPHIIDNEAL